MYLETLEAINKLRANKYNNPLIREIDCNTIEDNVRFLFDKTIMKDACYLMDDAGKINVVCPSCRVTFKPLIVGSVTPHFKNYCTYCGQSLKVERNKLNG